MLANMASTKSKQTNANFAFEWGVHFLALEKKNKQMKKLKLLSLTRNNQK